MTAEEILKKSKKFRRAKDRNLKQLFEQVAEFKNMDPKVQKIMKGAVIAVLEFKMEQRNRYTTGAYVTPGTGYYESCRHIYRRK